MEFLIRKRIRNASDAELIADVRKTARKLKKQTLSMKLYTENGSFHATNVANRFGSWFTVLELAGLKPSRAPFDITDDDLLENLEQVWIALGKQPVRQDMAEHGSKYSPSTYIRRFGTWNAAIDRFTEFIQRRGKKGDKVSPHPGPLRRKKRKRPRFVTDRLRNQILQRDHFSCRRCGRSPATELGVILHVDHVTSWDEGGDTVPENLETLCSRCNYGKSNL
jgi:5-methylcytosine-specific restriction endonuclease McrA